MTFKLSILKLNFQIYQYSMYYTVNVSDYCIGQFQTGAQAPVRLCETRCKTQIIMQSCDLRITILNTESLSRTLVSMIRPIRCLQQLTGAQIWHEHPSTTEPIIRLFRVLQRKWALVIKHNQSWVIFGPINLSESLFGPTSKWYYLHVYLVFASVML